MVWLHCSPAQIPHGGFVTPARERGGASRTHPNGYGDQELRWYDPDLVYVFDSGGIDPLQHMGRFAFTRQDYYWYEVEPDGPLGLDGDHGAAVMQSATCRRARVIRCLHRPDPVRSKGPMQPV
jgi:hypothetical protein